MIWLKRSSPGRTRIYDKAVNSRLLYQLSYRGSCVSCIKPRILIHPTFADNALSDSGKIGIFALECSAEMPIGHAFSARVFRMMTVLPPSRKLTSFM